MHEMNESALPSMLREATMSETVVDVLNQGILEPEMERTVMSESEFSMGKMMLDKLNQEKTEPRTDTTSQYEPKKTESPKR